MFELISLPYKDLSPYISAKTLSYHHGAHHKGYVNALNTLIQGTDYQGQSLEEIILSNQQKAVKIFNHATQLWNHNSYWIILTAAFKKNSHNLQTNRKIVQKFC
ncbi:unnamed protein product (macronuclear) [Paramecium tetraurelia]|uniref:superoxide dismutase n=1 Tax=Paramecium tetraurelia TaxID=5888 RepID=A0D834_PARTE|nr:uncharacterized protein GSPATT00014168001 [Paramecium tetraurelia]CAK79201.1 unnamed protein product [Paramecium tetraurelia]|eukprot:XP_001446598.1 hypothetical protein (macronuclear) [Paramecium tetraurelia strain d4-2]